MPCPFPPLRTALHAVPLAIALALAVSLTGCGKDDAPHDPAAARGANQAAATESARASAGQPSTPPLATPGAALLHDTGVETYAVGYGSDDPTAILRGISLLEQAAQADPGNDGLWLDLADAYLSSGLITEYPYAIDIYWMLLDTDAIPDDLLLGRLSVAYGKVGNSQGAFDTGVERVKRAGGDEVNAAALQLALLAPATDSYNRAAGVLIDKAGQLPDPAYLLLIASALEDAGGDRETAVKLIDQALEKLDSKSPAAVMARRERGRLSP